jgi:AcrR family transcriptional regulator
LFHKIERSCYFFRMPSPETAPEAPERLFVRRAGASGADASGGAETSGPETDGRRVRGNSTRRAILGRAMQLASAEGLEDLSIARLASDLGMSKSGLFAHFGSKEELQLSTLRAARRVFTDEAVTPALELPEGVTRLEALVTAWFGYIGTDVFAGGCLFMEAAAEFDNRPGPVRDMIAESMGMWLDLVTAEAARAVEQGELRAGTDPAQLAWELHAFGLGLNWDRQLNGAADARKRALVATRDRLAAAMTGKGRRRLTAARGA